MHDTTIHLSTPNTRILITGGSGFIGSFLCHVLVNSGHHVTILTRSTQKTVKTFNNTVNVIDSLENHTDCYDIIINLAGESINGRWTEKKKQAIYNSRLGITQELLEYISTAANRPRVMISGSAIGYYGSSDDTAFNEASNPADNGFTHDLCHQWEQMANKATELGVRVCYLRTGIVLGPDGGALKQMLLPFKLGLGGKMGNGKQWMSWIHIDDLIGIIAHCINNKEIDGPINGTSPFPVTNEAFTKTLGTLLHRPTLFPMPAFILTLLLGEMAETLLLRGQKVIPQKALDTGYHFAFPTLENALTNILKP